MAIMLNLVKSEKLGVVWGGGGVGKRKCVRFETEHKTDEPARENAVIHI